MLKANPIASRVRYYSKTDAKHCREFAPTDVDELHRIAGIIMSNSRSETLGWQLLFEGMTGLRCEEAVILRMDARADEPGGLTLDGGSICVRRAAKSQRYNYYLEANEGLKLVMAAHKIWHAARYPNSPWYFPGRKGEGVSNHVDKSALTKLLDRLYKRRILAKKYTSHGAGRAFYVLVRRSQRIPDPQIAYELNQTGGVATLEQVYGLPPEHWKNGNAPMLSWIPKRPAWTRIKDIPSLASAIAVPLFEI
jgi:hypothetical protein